MRIGIMSAMHEEINALIQTVKSPRTTRLGDRSYYEGDLWGTEAVLAFSRWGKVASASTVATLILKFEVDVVLFTGVAGAMDNALDIGDVVVGEAFYQHDMDARPIFKQFEIPLAGKSFFLASKKLNTKLLSATEAFLHSDAIDDDVKKTFAITAPKVITGAIASGDKFVSSNKDAERIKQALPQVKCVEMEGAAVAQVCAEYDVPFGIIRTISDSANHTADIDFMKFTQEVASKYSIGIIRNFLNA